MGHDPARSDTVTSLQKNIDTKFDSVTYVLIVA